jgi:hypothetical protein
MSDYVSTSEAARLLGRDVRTVTNYCHRYAWFGTWAGTRWIITRAEIERLQKQGLPQPGRP